MSESFYKSAKHKSKRKGKTEGRARVISRGLEIEMHPEAGGSIPYVNVIINLLTSESKLQRTFPELKQRKLGRRYLGLVRKEKFAGSISITWLRRSE